MPSTTEPILIFTLLLTRYGPRHWWPGDTLEEILIGAILTQNTAWVNVEKAIENLKGAGMLNGKALASASKDELADLIRPAGYFNQKARWLIDFFGYLDSEYNLDLDRFFSQPLPEVRAELLNLKGIGPETADSMLLYAGDLPSFVIDAYTFRVMKRVGLEKEHYQVRTKSGLWKDDYHTLQDYFQQALGPDVDLYNEFHAQFVDHAKNHCKTNPVCENCPLTPVCKRIIS